MVSALENWLDSKVSGIISCTKCLRNNCEGKMRLGFCLTISTKTGYKVVNGSISFLEHFNRSENENWVSAEIALFGAPQ